MALLKYDPVTGQLVYSPRNGKLARNCFPGCLCDGDDWDNLIDFGTPCNGLVQVYQIKDYVDGDIAASECDDCDNTGIPPTVWDGKFYASRDVPLSAVPCYWGHDTPNTYRIDVTELGLRTVIRVGATSWVVEIVCDHEGSGDDVILWLGTKLSVASPVGVYTRSTAGSGPCVDVTAPAELEIEEA